MASVLNYCLRRFFQTSAVRQAAKAAESDKHEGKTLNLKLIIKKNIF